MIAGDEKQRRGQPGKAAFQLVPLAANFRLVLGITLEQVSDRDAEIGLQQLELAHRIGEHAWPVRAGTIADDSEAEL